jgi:predicted CXXCH cytochrome family protein
MKINMLLILLTTVNILCVAGNAGNDSGETWGLHEPLKNCVSCHGDRSEQASAEKPNLIAPVPKLCYGCHKEYLSPDGWVHGPVATGKCLLCHEPHEADNKSLLSKPVPELCYQCHGTESMKSIANHSDKSYENCIICHEGHISPGRMLLKQDFLRTDAGLDYISKNPSIQPQTTFVDQRGSLSGLRGVTVVAVVEQSDLFKRYGLTEDTIRTKVEMQLRRNGVRVINREERIVRQSWLYVYLRLMEVPSRYNFERVEALSGSLNIFLRQKVELLNTPGDSTRIFCTATTWDMSGIVIWGTTQVEEGLDETIRVLVEKFSKDYRKANPKDQTSTQVNDEH